MTNFMLGFNDELMKTAKLPIKELLAGALALGVIGGLDILGHYTTGLVMNKINDISPRTAMTLSGAGVGASAQALLNKGRITKGPALVGALGGALYPNIRKSWQEL